MKRPYRFPLRTRWPKRLNRYFVPVAIFFCQVNLKEHDKRCEGGMEEIKILRILTLVVIGLVGSIAVFLVAGFVFRMLKAQI